MQYWTITVVIALAMPSLTAGCRDAANAKAKAATAERAKAALAVSVATVSQQDVPLRVNVTGTLAAWEEATVSLEAEGRITELRVDLGDRVQKGSVLARISPEVYEFRKVQAEAELLAAEAEFKRLQTLVVKDMATRQQLDESQRRVGVARANVDLARKQYADTTLKAPIGGKVSRRMINLGEYVRSGTAAFVIVRTSPLKLRVDVPERYYSNVKVGDTVEASGEALGGRVLQGKVVRISPAVSVDSRSFPVEARFENEDGSVAPGIFARATIRTGNLAQALILPESAVVSFAGNPRVFVVDGGRVHERTIEIGGRFQSRILVSKGVTAGETVVSSGVDLLSDGVSVTVRQADSTP
jgi:membrane fusion protein (multidrug efflux system)